MKKSFFISLVCLTGHSHLAQPHLRDGCYFGIKTGAAFTAVAGSRPASIPKTGFAGGIWLWLKLTKKWTSAAEVLFVEKGTGRSRTSRFGYNHFYSIRSYYFEVPILFQYHQEELAFEFGPGFGYLADAIEFLQGSSSAGNNLVDPMPFYRREFSFNLGIVYTFKESWNLGCRYTNSVIPVRQGSSEPRYWQKDLYNCVFSLTLAHRLKVKHSKNREIPEDSPIWD